MAFTVAGEKNASQCRGHICEEYHKLELDRTPSTQKSGGCSIALKELEFNVTKKRRAEYGYSVVDNIGPFGRSAG